MGGVFVFPARHSPGTGWRLGIVRGLRVGPSVCSGPGHSPEHRFSACGLRTGAHHKLLVTHP